MDYTSDGIYERDIFIKGSFSGALGRQGVLTGSLMTGRGPGVPTGLVEVVGLAENDCTQSKNLRNSPPFKSVGLEGLEVDILKTSEGLGVDRPDLAGFLGSTLSSQIGCFTNFPELSLVELPEKGPSPIPKHGGSAKEGSHKGPKAVKDRKRRDKLVLGVDVSMVEAEDLSLTAVVGHVRGKRIGRDFLRRWAADQWNLLLESAPEVLVLTKGWFSFILHSKEEVDAVLRRQWSMLGVPIVLKS